MSDNYPNKEQNSVPEPILESLRQFNKHTNCTCLHCGYVGLMGIKEEIVPWYASWWTFLAACVIALPFVSAYAVIVGCVFAVIRFTSLRKLILCPNCKTDLIIK